MDSMTCTESDGRQYPFRIIITLVNHDGVTTYVRVHRSLQEMREWFSDGPHVLDPEQWTQVVVRYRSAPQYRTMRMDTITVERWNHGLLWLPFLEWLHETDWTG